MSNSNLQFNIKNSNESTILCCSNPRSPPEILKRKARFFEPLKIGTEMFLLKMMFLAWISVQDAILITENYNT